MNTTDTRMSAEEINLLVGMIGKVFEKYRCDEFVFSPTVYQIVGLYVGGKTYALLNEAHPLDYFGDIDDVSAIGVQEIPEDAIGSHIVGGVLTETPIGEAIEDILVVTDTEYMSKDGEDLFRYDFTAAIVFVLPDRQVVFERDCWFSEDFLVYRGPHAIDMIKTADENASKSDSLDVRMERHILHLARQNG